MRPQLAVSITVLVATELHAQGQLGRLTVRDIELHVDRVPNHYKAAFQVGEDTISTCQLSGVFPDLSDRLTYYEEMRTALGLRAHSGWAAMVAVAGTAEAPRVLERRRIVIADPEIPGSKQPYHAAAELPFRQAESVIRRAIESSRALALEAMLATVGALRLQGYEVGGCGILLGSGKALPVLKGILASHALIHAAEGEMFRDVLVWAAQECRLPVTGVREKGLDDTLLKRIASLGKLIGPPWSQDQKYATVAALMALAIG